jgi:indolepyruvate ferredoxin oxidoreductase alpha subunit
LTNAVQANDDITVVILDNYITAMTGFQPSLTTKGTSADESQQAEVPAFTGAANGDAIERAVRGLGVREVYSVDPFDEETTVAALRQAKSSSGVNVVVCHAPCVVNARRGGGARRGRPLAIDQALCNACSLCIRTLGCPAILVAEGEFTIDQDLCNGCGLCARVCQHDAIHAVVPAST